MPQLLSPCIDYVEPSGLRFLDLKHTLTEWFNPDMVLIGELVGQNRDVCQPLVFSHLNTLKYAKAFHVKDTTSEATLAHGSLLERHDAYVRYPKDPIMVDNRISGFIGVTLHMDPEQPLGILAMMFRKNLVYDEGVFERLSAVRSRASATLVEPE